MDAPLAGRLPRPRSLRRGAAPPLALLLLALASVFAFGGDRGQFYRPGERELAVSFMAVTVNLAPEHRFLGFHRRELGPGGEPRYVAYNRFPIGSYVLAKLAILPFGDDFGRRLDAVRLLMKACFAAAAVLAWLALARWLGDRWIALAATLLACSSYYVLDLHDVASAETSTNLLGMMLAFHGMVVFAQEGRFRQLLVKTAVAILLGWHVVALIAPFALIGLGGDLLRARAGGGARLEALARAARSRYLAYGAFSVLLCTLMLGWNLGNEYLAYGGDRPLDSLPSFRSILRRSGSEAAHRSVDTPAFLRGQLGAVAGSAIPFAAVDRLGLDLPQPRHGQPWPASPWFAPAGAAALAAALAGLRLLPRPALAAALLAAGWCWAIPFRGSAAVHEFEGMFHIGAPLVLCALALLGLRRALGGERAARALPAIALATAAAFVLSAALMGRYGRDAEAAALSEDAAADFRAMRGFTEGRSVLFDGLARSSAATRWHAISLGHAGYWLAGGYLQPEPIGSPAEWALASRRDYAVLPVDLGGSITPDNRRFHLYRAADLPRIHASIAAREPALRARFDLRLEGRALTYVREGCTAQDAALPFFLEAVPAGGGPARRLDFAFPDRGVRFGGVCVAKAELPGEPLAGLRTGQRHGGLPALWEASLPAGDPSFPLAASTWRDALGPPALSSAFEVRLDGRTLTYVREECANADSADRFFVRVLPEDAADLPADRRASGHESLSFVFDRRGLRYGGACLAAFGLPDYAILGVRTGQYGDAGEVWSGAFPLDPEAWRARYEAAAALEPSLRAAFDVRAEGRTLHYTREPCAAADAAARFFLHVTPLDAADLPAERRASGFANLDFAFGDRGLRYEGRCLASIPLPDYPVARLATGQFEGDARLWEGEIAFGAPSE